MRGGIIFDFIESSSHKIIGSTSEKKIISFLDLKPGWDSGKGVPPSQENIRKALRLADLASFWDLATDVFPGTDGEIMVTVYHNDDYWEFTIEKDGAVTAAQELQNKETFLAEGVSFQDALKMLKDFGMKLWSNVPESSRKDILPIEEGGSPTWFFRTPVGQEYWFFQEAGY
jgi:hypothetical protein